MALRDRVGSDDINHDVVKFSQMNKVLGGKFYTLQLALK